MEIILIIYAIFLFAMVVICEQVNLPPSKRISAMMFQFIGDCILDFIIAILGKSNKPLAITGKGEYHILEMVVDTNPHYIYCLDTEHLPTDIDWTLALDYGKGWQDRTIGKLGPPKLMDVDSELNGNGKRFIAWQQGYNDKKLKEEE